MLIGNSGVGKSCILTRFSVSYKLNELARQIQSEFPEHNRCGLRNYNINLESKVHQRERIELQTRPGTLIILC